MNGLSPPVLLVALLVALPLPLLAAERQLGMSERTFKVMDDARQALDLEDFDGAVAVLERALSRGASSYEAAQMQRLLGLAHYRRDDLPAARRAYADALVQPRLPDSLTADLLASLGRLGLMADDYRAAQGRFEALLEIPGQDTPEHRVLLATALLRLDDDRRAADLLESAITAVREGGSEPREAWLTMLSAAYYALEELKSMQRVLKELIALYPRDQYLLNLAAIYGQLGEQSRQLALMEALLDAGRIERETQLKTTAQLYLAEQLPFKAARLLQTTIDEDRLPASRENLELLSQAWYLARDGERALEALRRAAEQAEDGALFLRIAGLELDAYRWRAADAAAERALAAGLSGREGDAWLIRGMARVRLGDYQPAMDHFRRAAAYDGSRAYAQQWTSFALGELRRVEQLQR